jgi:hypothetical protein
VQLCCTVKKFCLIQDLRFLQWCCWEFWSYEMWCCAIEWVVPDISKIMIPFCSRVKQSKLLFSDCLTHEDEGTMICRLSGTSHQRHVTAPQKTWIVKYCNTTGHSFIHL